jgi:CBS domain-containing membrane protein
MLSSQRRKELGANLYWQPLCASVFIAVFIYILKLAHSSNLAWALGAGAMSSTAYIVFGSPSKKPAQFKSVMGGYLLAMACGFFIQIILQIFIHYTSFAPASVCLACVSLFSALVVGLTLFVMALFDCEHPPAAGLAMMLVIDLRGIEVLLIILLSALLISIIRLILRNRLKDLLPLTLLSQEN